MIKKIVIGNLISYGISLAIGLASIPVIMKVSEKIIEKSISDFDKKD